MGQPLNPENTLPDEAKPKEFPSPKRGAIPSPKKVIEGAPHYEPNRSSQAESSSSGKDGGSK